MLTFRTYGTWLHGDERGSVDEEHNTYGAPLLDPDERRFDRRTRHMGDQALVFDSAMRGTAEAAIRDECVYCQWELIELAVRSNHVHVILAYAHVRPERMAQRLKSRVTRWLRQRSQIGPNQRVWVDGAGSRKYLWTERDVADAALYVREYQDEPRG